jgi:hypothetical protein
MGHGEDVSSSAGADGSAPSAARSVEVAGMSAARLDGREPAAFGVGVGVAVAAPGREPREVGVEVRPVAELAAQVQAVVAGFDPEVTGARDCLDLVGVFRDLEHAASAWLALAARRVAQTSLWADHGHRTAAHWLAAKTGLSVGEAMRLLETAEVAEQAPVTMEALKNGGLSIPKARAVGKAEAADPDAGAELVERAASEGVSVREIETDSARIVHAASGETEASRAERIRRNRSFRVGSNGDGSSWFHGIGPTTDIARLEAALKPILDGVFQDARQQGRREPVDAYTFDALVTLTDRGAIGGRHAGTSGGGDSDAGAGSGPDADTPGGGERDAVGGAGQSSGDTRAGGRHGHAKVIVRADLAALDRGHTEPGEVCEIAGHGPIPVADVWKMIDGGAFIAGIVTHGTDMIALRHLGRRPTALQRTVLQWETAGTCAVEGCTNNVRIEIDHVDPWAHTHTTDIDQLAGLCSRCHRRKTHEGFTLGPRLPTGKRHLHPPRHPAPPGEPVPAGEQAEQHGLFDTN